MLGTEDVEFIKQPLIFKLNVAGSFLIEGEVKVFAADLTGLFGLFCILQNPFQISCGIFPAVEVIEHTLHVMQLFHDIIVCWVESAPGIFEVSPTTQRDDDLLVDLVSAVCFPSIVVMDIVAALRPIMLVREFIEQIHNGFLDALTHLLAHFKPDGIDIVKGEIVVNQLIDFAVILISQVGGKQAGELFIVQQRPPVFSSD